MLVLTGTSTLNSIAQFVTVLVIFVGVLALTWFVTRWTATFQKGRLAGGNVEVLESFKIAPNIYVEIIRLTDKYVAVAISKDSVTLLTELDEDALIHRTESLNGQIDFKQLFDKVKEKHAVKETGAKENDDE